MIENNFDDVTINSVTKNDNEKRTMQMVELAKTHPAITICITDFTYLLKQSISEAVGKAMVMGDKFEPVFDPITDREILKQVFYGRVKDMEIYLNKSISPGSYIIGKVLNDNQ